MGFETHTPTSDELWAFCLFVVVDVLSSLSFASAMKRDPEESNEGGELPSFSMSYKNAVARHNGNLYDFCILPLGHVLLESFSFSFTYGAIATLGVSFLFSQYFSAAYGWIFVINISFFVLCFQCAFATNGVHVMTSHEVHVIYYFSGLLSVFLYDDLPAFYLVLSAIVVKLTTWYKLKQHVWPNYPFFPKVAPMFQKTDEPQENDIPWKLWMTPCIHNKFTEDEINLFNNKVLLGKGYWYALTRLGVPIINYEAMNMMITSVCFFGGWVGFIVRTVYEPHRYDSTDDFTAIYIAVASSFTISLIFVLLNSYHHLLDSRMFFYPKFYPRTSVVLSFTLGSLFIAANDEKMLEAEKWATELVIIAHAAHICITLLMGLTCLASCNHVGCWAAWARNLPGVVYLNGRFKDALQTVEDTPEGLRVGKYIIHSNVEMERARAKTLSENVIELQIQNRGDWEKAVE